MSIDLTEAVEIAARAVYEDTAGERDRDWLDLPASVCLAYREYVLPVVAAAPAIEAAVRTQVTAELHEGEHPHPCPTVRTITTHLEGAS